jgi:hypothetical protein
VHGPHIFNNAQLYRILESLGLSESVEGTCLASRIRPWLTSHKETYEEPENLKDYRKKGVDSLMRILMPHLQGLREKKE